MAISNDVFESKIYKSLIIAYGWLYELGQNKGHWEEIRSTALVGICLHFREAKNSTWLKSVASWLLQQQLQMEQHTASWAEEIWDSGMALIALHHLGESPKNPQIKKAFNYLKEKYNLNGRNNWHDEPWETSWAILAILEYDQDELLEIAENATKWLLSLQDSEGRVVSPHYTAYFIQICYLLSHRKIDEKLFEEAMKRSSDYLLSIISEKKLWTGEAWSNGQILWCLSRSKQFPVNNQDLMVHVINWFEINQDINGMWTDIEDTASSIIGLYYLLRQLKSSEGLSEIDAGEKIFNTLRRYQSSPVLQLKRKFIEKHEDGTFIVNITPRILRIVSIISLLIVAFITLREFYDKILESFEYCINTFILR